eukprot:jgi/Psemu1/5036/gm1.5036_g
MFKCFQLAEENPTVVRNTTQVLYCLKLLNNNGDKTGTYDVVLHHNWDFVFDRILLVDSYYLAIEEEDLEPPIAKAFGNTTTCDIQGFFTTIGAIGVPIYLCSLSIFYFCIIRLNLRDHSLKKIEPFLHAAPILYSLFCGTVGLTKQYFNNAGSVCYVAPSPTTCEMLPDVECNRGEGASGFRRRVYLFPRQPVDELVETNYSVVWNKLQSFGSKVMDVLFCMSSSEKANDDDDDDDNNKPSGENECPSQPKTQLANTRSVSNRRRSSHSSHLSRRRSSSQRERHRSRQTTTQAMLYVGSYVLSYGFVWAQTIYIIATNMQPPKVLMLLSSIFFPLQGFINVFIYCRPHIVSLRRSFPDEYSWFQAFVRVLNSGGDDPLTTQERRMIRRLSSNRTVSQQSTAPRRSSGFLSGRDYSDAGSSEESLALSIAKTELCERRLSVTSRTDVEDQSVEELARAVCDEFNENKRTDTFETGDRGQGICIPRGDAEQAPPLNRSCNAVESSLENYEPLGSSVPKCDVLKGYESGDFIKDSTHELKQEQTKPPAAGYTPSSVTTESYGDEDGALDDVVGEVFALANEAEKETNNDLGEECSPFLYLFNSGNVQALLNCFGVNYKVFAELLDLFQPIFDSYTINRDTNAIHMRKIATTGRKPEANATCCLVYKWLKFSRKVLLFVLQKHPKAMVTAPTEEEVEECIIWAATDGLEVKIKHSMNWLVQSYFYNSWVCDTYVNSVFVFASDGRIHICSYNYPGNWHDSAIADHGKEEEQGRLYTGVLCGMEEPKWNSFSGGHRGHGLGGRRTMRAKNKAGCTLEGSYVGWGTIKEQHLGGRYGGHGLGGRRARRANNTYGAQGPWTLRKKNKADCALEGSYVGRRTIKEQHLGDTGAMVLEEEEHVGLPTCPQGKRLEELKVYIKYTATSTCKYLRLRT